MRSGIRSARMPVEDQAERYRRAGEQRPRERSPGDPTCRANRSPGRPAMHPDTRAHVEAGRQHEAQESAQERVPKSTSSRPAFPRDLDQPLERLH